MSTVPDTEPDSTRTAAAGASGLGPGARIGRYRVEARLGAGGMGEVYLGHDAELERKVAIKRVLPGLVDERQERRLRREAQALAKLSHPNVVQIYEIGVDEGRLFLAMEYVEGRTLGALIAAGEARWPELLRLFVAAGRGLAAAHEAGVVHRDFKPDNVLLGRDGSVRVADFGLALASPSAREAAATGEGPTLAVAQRLSVTGALMGTIRYMPPEQLFAREVDARGDQFAFCVALYEALWGTPPYALDSLAGRMDALEAGELIPPPRGRVPRSLWRVLRRGLSPDPAARWPDMGALLVALERLPRRRRLARASALGGLLAIVAGLGAWAFEIRDTRAEVRACVREGQAIRAHWNPDTRARLERSMLTSKGEQAPQLWALARAQLDAYVERWTRQRARVCVEGLDPERRPALHDAKLRCLDDARANLAALIKVWLADEDEVAVIHVVEASGALPPLSMCEHEAWLSQYPEPDPDHAEAIVELRERAIRARARFLLGGVEAARELSADVLRDAEALGWPPMIAEARLAHARVVEYLGEGAEAQPQMHQAYLEATAAEYDFIALRSAIALANHHGRAGEFDRAFEWLGLAEVLLDQLGLRGTMHEASFRYARSRALAGRGEHERAVEELERVIVLDRTAHGPVNADLAVSFEAMARYLIELGREREAIAKLESALEIHEQLLGTEHPRARAVRERIAELEG